MRILEYYINLDERGEFYADVRMENGVTIFEIKGFDIFRDGFMSDKNDIYGLKDYLISLSILKEEDEIVSCN